MSVYFVKGKGWRYDFTLNGTRHTEAWFKTKKEARKAEADRREDILSPIPVTPAETVTTPTDMDFLELVNKRLDHVKAYNSDWHYRAYRYMCKRWIKHWGNLPCIEITREMVQEHILIRSKISSFTANKDLRYLRATFNFGIRRGHTNVDPTKGIDFLPVDKKFKYIPMPDDIKKVIAAASPDIQDYLWIIRDTMARISEVNRLTWDDVNLSEKYIVLYTRKKRRGDLTPRKVAMTNKVFEVLSRRYNKRKPNINWVFWHIYRDPLSGDEMIGPYKYRRTILKTLCKKVSVKHFGFHALRHSGASIMDQNNVPIGAIQRILGHENRSTTEIYLHSLDYAEREAINVYESARENSHTTLTQRLETSEE